MQEPQQHKKPRTVTVPITLDPDLENAVTTARTTLDREAQRLLETFNARVAVEAAVNPEGEPARRVYDQDLETLADLEQAVEDAEAALVAGCRQYTFQSIGYTAWKALKALHTKNKEIDDEALLPDILRDASVDPKLSNTAVEDLLNDPAWSEGEIALLYQAAVSVQV